MIFEIGGYDLPFRLKEFYLITDFRFCDYFVDLASDAAFRSRAFPMVPRNVSVKFDDIITVFKRSINELSDEDLVRVCLLYLLQKGVNERLPK